MSEYEPGTVAVATVRGNEGVRAFRMPAEWVTAEIIGGCRWHNDSDVTGVRPLVALDIDDPDLSGNAEVRRQNLLDHLRRGTAISRHLADQIEAQTKPLRIPEPGLWGVVEAGDPPRDEWVRYRDTGLDYEAEWLNTTTATTAKWDDLRNPVLVRDGISE